jgi:hypothetical protein
MSLSALCFQPRRSPDEAQKAGAFGSRKNTGDLQWKIDAVCNVRVCKGERNDARARTMGSNGKAMRRTMKNTGGATTSS